MWFRTPEKVCSSSYALRAVCAPAARGPASANVAALATAAMTLLECRKMLFGNRGLSFISARGESDVLSESGFRIVLPALLLQQQTQKEVRTRVARVGRGRLTQRRDGLVDLSGSDEGLS